MTKVEPNVTVKSLRVGCTGFGVWNRVLSEKEISFLRKHQKTLIVPTIETFQK